MLPKQLRLRHPADFARLRRNGRVVRHAGLLLSVLPNQRAHNRYGFITSRSLGNAVIRNRIKRQLREAVRHKHPHFSEGYDMVWVARKAIVAQPYGNVVRIVSELASQAEIMQTGSKPE